VHSTSTAELNDLTAAAQEQVKQGITAQDEPDAERRLAELTNEDPANPNLKPLCPPGPTPTVSVPNGAGTPTPSSTATSALPNAGEGSAQAGGASPTTSPEALPSDTVSPVTDPAGCRSSE
jgi:hypothetical protein